VRAIILAAGSGMRMGKYTENLPKGMLSVGGKTLIERQLAALRAADIEDIIIATGYRAETINYSGVTYAHNPKYAETNMVETLLCCRDFLNTDILVCYSDIIYTPELAGKTADSEYEIAVAADTDWRKYWNFRYGTTETDLETFSVGKDFKIIDIGKPLSSSEGIDYRYIGLIKFSEKALIDMIEFYDAKKKSGQKWLQSGKEFKKGYMTDLLNELIISGSDVRAVPFKGGWREFDTERDYELLTESTGNALNFEL